MNAFVGTLDRELPPCAGPSTAKISEETLPKSNEHMLRFAWVVCVVGGVFVVFL